MDYVEDRYYHRMPAGGPNQGDVWSGLPGGPYSATHVSGIIITPRCDLAHDKTRLLNYVPIVSIDEYSSIFGGFALLGQEEGNVLQTQRNLASKLGVVELYDLGVDVPDIRNAVQKSIDAEPTEKRRERIEQTYSEFAQQILRRSAIQEALAKSTI